MTNMQRTIELGADFWNDSCAVPELADAVENGATGATSNPVIAFTAIKADPKTWVPVLDGLIGDHPEGTEEEVAWPLLEEVGRRAAAVLAPVHERTRGRKGFLSMQVNPKLYRDARRMAEHGRALAAVAPNVAIKVPAVPAGIKAGEELIAAGINVNATVSFTIPQVLHTADAFERALDRARAGGADMDRMHPYITIMVGRLDDLVQRAVARDAVTVDPGLVHWAGIAVFKKARQIFKKKGYRSTLLAAAYRHHLHWSELIGPGVILSMPYPWWKQFNASDVDVAARLDEPVEGRIVETLRRKFEDFRKAYDEDGMAPEDFVHYGATIHTLNQFIAGYQDLLGFVRERMLR